MHFIEGIKSRYPLCCILEFCLDQLKGKAASYQKGAIIKDGRVQNYVPCYFHRKLYRHISYQEMCVLTSRIPAEPLIGSNDYVARMPDVRCWGCGNSIFIDSYARPYNAEIACPNCGSAIRIHDDFPTGGMTSGRMFPSLDDISKFLDYLTDLEKNRLREASHSFGCGAYTACESMCFDALSSLCRRIYGGKGELGHCVDKMEQDTDLSELAGAIAYFKHRRDKVDHPVSISTKLDGESTFLMTKRLIIGIVKKKLRNQQVKPS